MDRSIQKNGSPIVRVGQRWQSNDRRDLKPGFARVVEVLDFSATSVWCRVVSAGRPTAVGGFRKIRRSAFLGGSRGFTLVRDVEFPVEGGPYAVATPAELVTP